MTDRSADAQRFSHSRKSPRTQVQVFDTSALSTGWRPEDPGTLMGQVLDITPAGMRLRSDRTPPAVGQELRLHLTCGTDEPLHADLSGLVRWHEPSEFEGFCELGIEFTPDQPIEETRELARIVLFHCG